MELSTFSYIIGIASLLFLVPLLVNSTKAMKFITSYLADDLTVRIMGGVLFILAFLTLKGDFSIGSDAAGLLRLVAWLTLLKGLVHAWWPERARAMKAKTLSNASLLPLFTIAGLAFGVLVIWGATLV